ncbi:hypothetical protein O4D10_01815 [Xanthomonas citri pv. citri]|uniref:hypothetical protein n=1 Tax=Xanthomonas citri TaxID=346 RepID=UPI0036DF9AFA
MKPKIDLEKFQELLINWISSVVKPEDAANPDAYTSEELALIDNVFRRFTELTDAVDRLDLCLTFIKGCAPRRKDLKLYDYLMYHLTFYIQEVYILNERMESYANTILRLRKKRGLPAAKDRYDGLLESVRLPLSQIVFARGSHVHDRAFNDERMRELSMFSFLAVRAAEKPEWSQMAKDLYRASKATWIEQLTANRKAISTLLDQHCNALLPEVAELLPNNSFKPKPLRGSA